MLNNKNIVLGVCGSIAAYKSPSIVRRLQDLGANVKVVITASGEKFITKLSLETVSKNPVYSNLWDSKMEHISLAKWADIVLIAPISANTIAKIASGKADDLLSNIILATDSKIFITPAMNKQMLENIATQNNLEVLKNRGFKVIASDFGEQACGDIGKGRMAEPVDIANFIAKSFYSKLVGKKIVITLGATIEKIDPVRYISNFSSGKMGVAIAKQCLNRGANVVIIYGNIATHLPKQSINIQALSADKMFEEVKKQTMDIFISTAAVSDYKVKNIAANKIKKTDENLNIELIKNIDILKEIASQKNRPFCVGFAAESENLLEFAKNKLEQKNLDMIVANDIKDGFGSDTNKVIIIDKNSVNKLEKDSKDNIAKYIIETIEQKI